MPVNSGEVLESNILAIKKGEQGSPGELKVYLWRINYLWETFIR